MTAFYAIRVRCTLAVPGPAVVADLTPYIGGWIVGIDGSWIDTSGTPGLGWVQVNMGTAVAGVWDPTARLADFDLTAGLTRSQFPSVRYSNALVPGLEISSTYPRVQINQAYANITSVFCLTILPPT